MKSKDNKILETGLTQNQTVDALKVAVISAITEHPDKFETYVKWFLNGSMYLLDEDDELLDVEEMLRLAR
ncbi:MAG: hypothetical protein COB15_12230 [Flavobacteriales bacterium]|nr:MAG: hypothetical protein COB15_12230 [Flavobacteriales bacterium]